MVKIGRHSKYEAHPDEWNLKVWLLASQGKTNKQICEELEISTQTLFGWQQKHPGFSSGVISGRLVACGKLEETLFNLAMGREIEESKTIGILKKDDKGNIVYEDDGKGGKKPSIIPHRVERVKKVVLPDRESLLACLRVWKPEQWNKAARLALGGDPDGTPLQITSLSDEELTALVIEQMEKKKGKQD